MNDPTLEMKTQKERKQLKAASSVIRLSYRSVPIIPEYIHNLRRILRCRGEILFQSNKLSNVARLNFAVNLSRRFLPVKVNHQSSLHRLVRESSFTFKRANMNT